MEQNIDRYTYCVTWDPRDDIYVARVAEFEELAAHGDTKEEALKELKVAVQASIDWNLEEGDAIPEPFADQDPNGRVLVKIMQPDEQLQRAFELLRQAMDAVETSADLKQHKLHRDIKDFFDHVEEETTND